MIRILSWNIWILEDNRSIRIRELARVIKKKGIIVFIKSCIVFELIGTQDVDIAFLVETTVAAQTLIEQQPYFRNHFYTSVVELKTQQSTYKVSVLTKFIPSGLFLYDIPWTARRVRFNQ